MQGACQRFALPACGRAEKMIESRKNPKPEKCYSKPQTPKNPLHALLDAVELEDSMAKKRHRRQHGKFLHTTQLLAMTKKQDLPKRQITKTKFFKDSLTE